MDAAGLVVGLRVMTAFSGAPGSPYIFVAEKNTAHTEWPGVHCAYVTHNLFDGIDALRRIIARR